MVYCFICGEKTTMEYPGICRYCVENLKEMNKEYVLCDLCGTFYHVHFSSCPQCFCNKQPRSYKKAISCFPYIIEAKKLVLGLKFNNARYLAPAMAKLITEHRDIAENGKYSCLIPVPLSKLHLREREFNQSEVLAQEISYLTDLPLYPKVLVKIKETKAQMDLDKNQRKKNLLSAFALTSGKEILGKNVILIDDIITTGSTVNQCAKVLKRGGAASVKVITFCGWADKKE
ncbi:MAG: ComF family protein [Clostridiales bacterium]